MKLAVLITLLVFVCVGAALERPGITSPDINWVLYKQCDSTWGSEELGTCSQDTICIAGCAMSSVAMYLATLGWKGNPGTLNAWLDKNGGYESGCLIEWGVVDKLNFTTCMGHESASYSEICSGAAAEHGVIINVRNGEHWVLVTGCPSGSTTVLNVNDPGFNQATYLMSDVVGMVVYHKK